jgi:predicted XRE-type DNA-binding protein
MSDADDDSIRRGTANVFADLGYADPDTHRLKAELIRELIGIMRNREMTQTEVAKVTGLSQPEVSRLLKGQFREVSVERIMRMLARLGGEIDIVVRFADKSEAGPVIHFHSVPPEMLKA